MASSIVVVFVLHTDRRHRILGRVARTTPCTLAGTWLYWKQLKLSRVELSHFKSSRIGASGKGLLLFIQFMLLGCVFVVREVRTRGELGESKMNRVMYSW